MESPKQTILATKEFNLTIDMNPESTERPSESEQNFQARASMPSKNSIFNDTETTDMSNSSQTEITRIPETPEALDISSCPNITAMPDSEKAAWEIPEEINATEIHETTTDTSNATVTSELQTTDMIQVLVQTASTTSAYTTENIDDTAASGILENIEPEQVTNIIDIHATSNEVPETTISPSDTLESPDAENHDIDETASEVITTAEITENTQPNHQPNSLDTQKHIFRIPDASAVQTTISPSGSLKSLQIHHPEAHDTTPKTTSAGEAIKNTELNQITTTADATGTISKATESLKVTEKPDGKQKEVITTPNTVPELPTQVKALVKRKLVTARRISKIEKICGGHKAVLHIDGWTVVVSNPRRWDVNDLVIYLEIDSFLPENQWFGNFFSHPELIETFRGKRGFRVKSFVDGKYLSQGLVYRIDHFDVINGPYQDRLWEVGQAVASEELLGKSFDGLLGVTKWEPEEPEAVGDCGRIGPPPVFVVNPAWHRAQNIAGEIFSRGEKIWQITEKLDGVTMQVYKVATNSKWFPCLPEIAGGYPASMRDAHGHVGVCGRVDDYIDQPDNLMWAAVRQQGLVAKIRSIPYPNIALQGEFCGSSIMGNTMKYPEGLHEFVAFGIWNFDTGCYIGVQETERICREFKIKHVPVKGYFQMSKFANSMEKLLAKANGTEPGEYGGISEGFVFKSLDGNEQFKVISNEWLALTGK